MSDKFQFKTPHTCVVCKSSLVEQFVVAYPQRSTSRRRIIGFNQRMFKQRLAEPVDWYPKSLGIMCPKCKIKYELPRQGYTTDQVYQRMMYIAIQLKKATATPITVYERESAHDKAERQKKILESLEKALLHNKKAEKEGGMRKRVPTKKEIAATQPSKRKVKPVSISGVMYVHDEFFRRNPERELSFHFHYNVPKGKVLVFKKTNQKLEQAYVISKKDYTAAKQLNSEIIDIL